MSMKKASYNVLQRATNEEVLLNQSRFAVFGIVVRVEYFGNGFTGRLFPNRFDITTFIKDIKVEP